MCRSYGEEEKKKLQSLIKDGAIVLQEVSDLKEGLKDAVKAVAEELGVKPAVINNAIRTAFKNDWGDKKADFEEVEAILDITGNISE